MPSLRPMKTFLMISIHSYYPQRREAFSTVWPMHFHQKCTEDAMSTNAHQCTIQEKRLFWVVMFVLQTILCVCTLYCFRNLQKICWWETEKLPWTNFLTLVFLSLPNTARSITSLMWKWAFAKYRITVVCFGVLKSEQKVDLISELLKKKVPSVPPPSVLLYSSQLVRFLSCWAILWSFQALHFKELLGCVKEGKIVKGEQQGKAQ